jgi:hypothetical protein
MKARAPGELPSGRKAADYAGGMFTEGFISPNRA